MYQDLCRVFHAWRRRSGIWKVFRYCLFGAALCMLLGGLFLACTNICVARCGDRVFADPELLPENEYGLLLGTSRLIGGKYINWYFAYRIDAAVKLYEKGKIRKIIVSGDNRREHYNEPEDMRAELIKRGVRPEDIMADYAGFRTLDSVVRARNVFGVRKMTVISQPFHCERAIFIADHHGIEAVGFGADEVAPRFRIRRYLREPASRLLAWCDVHIFRRQPYFPE